MPAQPPGSDHPRVIYACLREDPLSVDRALSAVSSPDVGGIALFVGTIRDLDEGHQVGALDYTHHPLAEAGLRDVAQRVSLDHDVVSVAVEHRTGHLEIGDIAVVVAVGAVHRAPALAACARLIDDLKSEVPIWKQQTYASGGQHWVGLPVEAALARWGDVSL